MSVGCGWISRPVSHTITHLTTPSPVTPSPRMRTKHDDKRQPLKLIQERYSPTEALREAQSLLKTSLTYDKIQELRALVSPPHAVVHTMAAVLLVLGETKFDWNSSRRVLSNSAFIPSIQSVDVWNLDPVTTKQLHHYLKRNALKPREVGKCSVAAKILCFWVKSIDLHHSQRITTLHGETENCQVVVRPLPIPGAGITEKDN